jgi:putative aldouronate transport system substrate-binding protein
MKSKALKAILLMLSTMTVAASMAGCSKTENKPTDSAPQEVEVKDPMAKYDPPVTVTVAIAQDDATKFVNGESWENNVWTKGYESELGIKVKAAWIVPGAQYKEKLNVSIASNDLPDIITATDQKLFRDVVENGYAKDLTEIYDKYAVPLTKDVMSQEPRGLESAKIDGKLMAIPGPASAIDGTFLLHLREDWRKKLNLPEPKTMNDLKTIMDAFAKQDPDGNGQADTFGLAVMKDLYGGATGLEGFFTTYHAYPKKWVEDSSGNLAYGSILPEVKTALQELQNMYKDGKIDKEFGVKDGGKVAETIASGKVGVQFGQMWNPIYPLQATIDNNAEADWKAYPLPSIDDKVAAPMLNMPVSTYYAVNAKYDHPEVVVKFLNFMLEKRFGKTADKKYFAIIDGAEQHKYSIVIGDPARKNLDNHLRILEAFETKDTSKLNLEQKNNYDAIVAYREGDNTKWNMERVFGTPSTFDVIDKYVNDNAFIYNGFYGAPTNTMSQKQATLDKLESEVFTKIIMGESIDEFDKFVEQWKSLGGEQITKEVNDWAAANKK